MPNRDDRAPSPPETGSRPSAPPRPRSAAHRDADGLVSLLTRAAVVTLVALAAAPALVLGIVCVIAVLAYLAIARLGSRIGSGIQGRAARQPPPRPPEAGPLSPMPGAPSTVVRTPSGCRMVGSLFRYQDRTREHRGSDFYKIFIDGNWKWAGQQRFAGVATFETADEPIKTNTGHFFGATQQAALAEISHYQTADVLANSSLLEVEVELDNILDLTDLDTIRLATRAAGITGNIYNIVADLVSVQTGGVEAATDVGLWACSRGYNGVRFFSARSMLPAHSQRLRESKYWDDVAEDLEKKAVLRAMQARDGGKCLAVFSGAHLTRTVKRYRFDDGAWEDNPMFGWAQESIEELWGEFGPDYQAEQGRVTLIT